MRLALFMIFRELRGGGDLSLIYNSHYLLIFFLNYVKNANLLQSNFGGETSTTQKVSSGCIYSIVAHEEKGILLAAGSSLIIDMFLLKNQNLIKSFSIK